MKLKELTILCIWMIYCWVSRECVNKINFLLFVGGVVLGGLIGAITFVSTFDPIRKWNIKLGFIIKFIKFYLL